MSWYVVTLSAEQVASGTLKECREAMEKSFAAACGPRTMALFKRELEEGRVELFFTPECAEHARELLGRWDCSPCERPSLVGLQLLVGHSEMTYYLP